METNTWRGLGRLWRLLAHILAGFWIVYTRFPRLGEAERRATVQRWAAEAVRRWASRCRCVALRPRPGRMA